jgi:hypothetical protein
MTTEPYRSSHRDPDEFPAKTATDNENNGIKQFLAISSTCRFQVRTTLYIGSGGHGTCDNWPADHGIRVRERP